MKLSSIIFLLLSFIIISCNGKKQAAKIRNDRGNLYAIFSDGTEKQLTFNKSDVSPYLINSKGIVVFIRVSGTVLRIRSKIMQVDIETLVETVLADHKPFEDGLDGGTELGLLKHVKLSADEKYLYFVVGKYATANELVRLNFETGKIEDLFSAENYEFVNTKQFQNSFLIGLSTIEGRGRDIYYKLVDSKGNVLKSFVNENEAHIFINNLEK